MAITPQKVDFSTINEVVNGGGISPEHINAPLKSSAYTQALATNQPDISEANNVGTPSVEIIETNGTPQFKFKNIKGAVGNGFYIYVGDIPEETSELDKANMFTTPQGRDFIDGDIIISTNGVMVTVSGGTTDTLIYVEYAGKIEANGGGSSTTASNPNILINSNFAINQRGATTYSTSAQYTVDRWRLNGGTLIVNADGTISHTASAPTQGIAQIIEKPSRFAGKTLFVSCKILAELFIYYSIALRLRKNGETTYQTLGSYDGSGGHIFIPTDITDEDTLEFYISNDKSNGTIKIYWAKLEESESATPYTTPDLAIELMRCQRYFVRLKGHNLISFSQLDSTYTSMPENVLSAYTGNFIVNLPSTMRTIPTLVSENVKVRHKGSLRNIVSLAINNYDDFMPHQIVLDVKASPENISQYDFAHLAIPTNGYIDLDAELYIWG